MLNVLRHIKHGSRRWLNEKRLNLGERKITKTTLGIVQGGAFAGLKLLPSDVFGSWVPKVLGTYEKELTNVLLESLARSPDNVCNIGGAEGYYAIGCALHPAVKHVTVYEALDQGQSLIRRNAELNNVQHKLRVHGFCSEQTLCEQLQTSSIDLMLIDIEGAELDILSDRNVAALSNTTLIIESHDFCRPNCLRELKLRFQTTHELTIIDSHARNIMDFPTRISMIESLALQMMDEKRPGVMQWLICQPREK